MATRIDSRALAAARPYALALLELAEEAGQEEAVLGELGALARELEADPALAAFLASPLIAEAERRRVLERAFRDRLSHLAVDLLQVMNRKGRLGLVRAVVGAARQELDRRRGRVEVAVATAVPLPRPLRERLERVLAQVTGREPRLSERVDPALLGGLTVSVEDGKMDASLAAQLRRLGDRLIERAPRALAGLME